MTEGSPFVDTVSTRTTNENPTTNQFRGSFTDHLANERTFLAWIRTGLGIFAFGCAIARFGGSTDVHVKFKSSFHEKKPIISGLIFIAASILILLYGIYRYYRVNRQIMRKDLVEVSQIREPIVATLILLLCMILILIIFVIL